MGYRTVMLAAPGFEKATLEGCSILDPGHKKIDWAAQYTVMFWTQEHLLSVTLREASIY